VHQWERGESQIAAYLTEDGAPRDIARSIGSFSDCHGLWYGNLYANYTFTDQITHICPNEAYFDPWRLQYQAASSWNPSQEHLLIISYYAYNANPAVLRPGEDFEVLEDAELILVRSNGVDDQAE
jgi:hypothetical protein